MKCPRARSEMTPCVIKDGAIAYAISSSDTPICVGCEKGPTITGIDPPKDWAQQVASYKYEERKRNK